VQAFVLDASIALAWFFKDESNPLAEHVFALVENCDVHVPYHWYAEVANSMIVGERNGRAEKDWIEEFAQTIERLDILVETPSAEQRAFSLIPLARTHRLTIYDALYLSLAQRRALPIATLDKALARAARGLGVTVLEE
jgi:predicted nucleic acid-binding protein